jgi:hypothetical protein
MHRIFLIKILLLAFVFTSNGQTIPLPREADKWKVVSAFFEGKFDAGKKLFVLGGKHGDLSEEPFLRVDTIFRYKLADKEYQHLICVKSQKDNECTGCQVAVSQIRLVFDKAKNGWVKDFFIEDQFECGSLGQAGAFALLPITHTEVALAVEDDFFKDGLMTTWYSLYSKNDRLLEMKLVEDNEGTGVDEGSVYSFQASIDVDKARGILTIQRFGTMPVTGKDGKASVQPVKETIRYLYKEGKMVKL